MRTMQNCAKIRKKQISRIPGRQKNASARLFFQGERRLFRKHVYKFRTITQSISEFRPLSIQLLEDSIYCRQTDTKHCHLVILSSCQNRFGIVKTRQYKINKYIYLLKVLTRFSFDFDKMTR